MAFEPEALMHRAPRPAEHGDVDDGIAAAQEVFPAFEKPVQNRFDARALSARYRSTA